MKLLTGVVRRWATLSVVIALLMVFSGMNMEAYAENTIRYEINSLGDEVYDKTTDLTWMRCSLGQIWKQDVGCFGPVMTFTFAQAQEQTTQKWRVPTRVELDTLVDRERMKKSVSPTIDVNAFPDMDMKHLIYWTSNHRDDGTWFGGEYVYFAYGTGGLTNGRNIFAVRMVRSGR